MSTRAMYTFYEDAVYDKEVVDTGYHVYKHHDGYPKGAARWIEAALPHAWQGGRFEADEFAAAFVAANKSPYINQELELLREFHAGSSAGFNSEKTGRTMAAVCKDLERVREYARNAGGGVRLMHSGSVYAVAPADIEWRYEITSKKGALHVACYSTDFWEMRTKTSEELEFKGTLEAFKAWALKGEGK